MSPTPIQVEQAARTTPLEFILNGTGDLTLESVTATVDGAGAGATFDAVLSLYTQDGKLLSRTKPSTSIAAGSSAIVTWAPFLSKPAPAAAGPSLGGAAIYYTPQNPIIPTAAATLLHFVSFSEEAITVNETGGAGNHHGFSLPDTGMYLIQAGVAWPAFNATRYLEVQVGANTDHMNTIANRDDSETTPAGDFQQVSVLLPVFSPGGATVDVNVYQASGANQTITDAYLYIFMLWPFPFL